MFFEIFLQTKFQDITLISSDDVKSDIADHALSLHICCFATELVEETYRSLQHNARPEDIALAIFSLKTEWPTQGHLIITVNPQNENNCAKRIFLPEKLVSLYFVFGYYFLLKLLMWQGPMNPPICINDLVHEGQNIVQFIQLSNMAGKVFALCATQKQNGKPDEVTYASKEENTIGTHSSVVKVLPL